MSGLEFRIGIASASNNDNTKTVTASCVGGKVAIGGGHTINMTSNGEPPFITRSIRTGTNTWTITASEGSITGNFSVTAYVMCVNP